MPIPSRKVCVGPCRRWRLCTDFRPRSWNEDESQPAYLAGDCNYCHKAKSRQLHQPKITAEVRKIRHDEEFFILHNKLDAQPFSDWLRHRVEEIGMANVASAAGVDPRRIYTIIQGRYYQSYMKQWYDYKYVQLQTVDNIATALGYSWYDVYPWLIDLDPKQVRDRINSRRRRARRP